MNNKIKLVGQKIGITQIFNNKGHVMPITIIYIPKYKIIEEKYQKKTVMIKINYNHKKKHKIYEMNIDKKQYTENKINISLLKINNYIDISGKSKGKGYSGVMKKYNFKGLEDSHGVSKAHRSQGSIGQCQDPGKVFKGKKMSGQMGNKKKTIQNLQIIDINKELNIILVRGSIPGYKKNYIYIKKSIKK